ncbi:MAG: aminoglycoside phosphotransferase family protein [Actinobacteria bacterium]|nr:aminoglycoside phosphotransferase family protein [Actinomycetota bacterium]
MGTDGGRTVQLVLVDRSGLPLGVTPAFDVELPWWQEAGPVVRGARRAFGLDVVVLRLLEAGSWPGGKVTYVAEALSPPAIPLAPAPVLDEQPLRLTYARAGGPAADIAWADDHLARIGRPRTGPAEQVRTWNLSSLWRLPAAGGPTWLKVVPPFFAHEPALIRLLDDPVLPPLLAGEPGRSLLEEVAGTDGYEASSAAWLDQLSHLVRLQRSTFGRTDELLSAGLPDRRAAPLAARIERAAGVARPAFDAPERAALDALVLSVEPRLARAAALGVPDGFVHGDAHPGNARFTADTCVALLDWGDAVVGNPLLDLSVVAAFRPEADEVLTGWLELWQAALPAADISAAWAEVRPLGNLRAAAVFQGFLDAIEPAERRYHESDPVAALRRAIAEA